jgi:threonine dehydratase
MPALVETSDITLQQVFAARHRIAPHVRLTPFIGSPWLSSISGADVLLKLESLQVTNSFKARGAVNATRRWLDRHDGASPRGPLVTASAGNHGRAMAYAARQFGLPLVVFTPRDAPQAKLAPIRALGADLRAEGDGYEDAERRGLAFARAEGLPFISPYNDPDVIAGAGTVAIEMLEQEPALDILVVPVGGGGLLAGMALTAKAISTRISVVGAEAEASPAFSTALAAGRIVEVAVGPTLADGLAGNMEPDSITFALVQRWVDSVGSVDETGLADAIRGLITHDHLVAEGAGAAGVAAVASGRLDVRGRRVGIVVSGANIDAVRLGALLTGG